jgi:hypothetical protein
VSKSKPGKQQEASGALLYCLLLACCLAYFSNLKMEAVRYSETLAGLYQNTGHHIQEDIYLRLYSVVVRVYNAA